LEIHTKIYNQEISNMKNPLDSISGTIVAGLVLTLVLYLIVKNVFLAGA
jgi:hypothetical protein